MTDFICAKCGKKGIQTGNFIDMIPNTKDLMAKGQTGFTKFVRSLQATFDGKNFESNAVWSHWLTNLVFLKHIKNGDKIIDLGAGSCELEFLISLEKPKSTMVVEDLAPSGLRELAKEYPKSVVAMKNDICDCLHIQKPQFDVAIMSHVLEHNEKSRSLKLLDDAISLLKPHGKVLICAENGTGIHDMHPDGKYHFYFFGHDELIELLTQRNITIDNEYGLRLKYEESSRILNDEDARVFRRLKDMDAPSGWLVNLFALPYPKLCRDLIIIGHIS